MNGKLAAALDLKTLAGRTHLYGLGPIEQLRGEVTIADSCPALARVAPDGTVNVTASFDAGVPFFVWAEVPQWVVCHERAVCVQRCGTVREMKEGPSRPAVRCRSQATASCCRQERWL